MEIRPRHVLDLGDEGRRGSRRDRNHRAMRVLAIVAVLLCAPPTAVPAGSAQLVTVTASGYGTTFASLELWQRRGACWRRVAGPWQARLGRSGLSTHKREGDGSTPTGTYRLGPTVYGIAPDPGVAFAY